MKRKNTEDMTPQDQTASQTAPQFVILYRPSFQKEARHDSLSKQPGASGRGQAPPRFLAQVLEVMEQKLGDAHYTVEDLCRELGVSYSSLNRKLQQLTGKSAVSLLRSMRLQRAEALLANTGLSVSEVAYETGFTSPSYFSRIFTREIGIPPSAYQKRT